MKFVAKQTTPKVAGSPTRQNEDVFRPSHSKRDISRFVLCDGATTSFAGHAWAEALAEAMVIGRMPQPDSYPLLVGDAGYLTHLRDMFFKAVITTAKNKYEKVYDISKLSFFKQEAFKRGSASTFLMLEQDPTDANSIAVTSIGDTCVFVATEEGRIAQSFPLTRVEEFSTSAYLVESRDDAIAMLFDSQTRDLYWRRTTLDLNGFEEAKLVCATDAVSQWIVANKDNLDALRGLFEATAKSKKAFSRFIGDRRLEGAMGIDDSTVVILEK